jgi:hypothetical protein
MTAQARLPRQSPASRRRCRPPRSTGPCRRVSAFRLKDERAALDVPRPVRGLRGQEVLQSGLIRRLLRRHVGFGQREQRDPGRVGIRRQGRKLRPAAVGALQRLERARRRVDRTAVGFRPFQTEQLKARSCVRSALVANNHARPRSILALVSPASAGGAYVLSARIMYAVGVKSSQVSGGRADAARLPPGWVPPISVPAPRQNPSGCC